MSSAAFIVVPRHLTGRPQDDVVAGLPEHGLVVRQHAEMMGRLAALGVEVVDVAGVAGRGQRGGHLVGVLRLGGTGLRRADAGDVLGREDQHVAADVAGTV